MKLENGIRLFGVFLIFGLLTGCSGTAVRGTVVMKIDEETGHVCLGDGEVKVGDSLYIYSTSCVNNAGIGRVRFDIAELDCKKERIGNAKVVKIINSHYSTFQVTDGAVFKEGTLIEKL